MAAQRAQAPAPDVPSRALLALAALYCAGAYALSWACWGAAALVADAAGALGGALQVLGTLCPPIVCYLLFPRMRACGLVPPAPIPSDGSETPDPRAGFWRFAFGGASSVRGWVAFFALFAWRWAMFRLAFGFPATPVDALANAAATLPALLLGGGFEEIGWRGCLQPALTALVGRHAPARARAALCALVPAVTTGLVWGAWHLPLFFMEGTFQSMMPFAPILGVGVALSCSFGALGALTGSLLYPIAAHAWYNAMLVAVPQFGPLAWALFALEALAGVVLTVRATRRPAGAQPLGRVGR